MVFLIKILVYEFLDFCFRMLYNHIRFNYYTIRKELGMNTQLDSRENTVIRQAGEAMAELEFFKTQLADIKEVRREFATHRDYMAWMVENKIHDLVVAGYDLTDGLIGRIYDLQKSFDEVIRYCDEVTTEPDFDYSALDQNSHGG